MLRDVGIIAAIGCMLLAVPIYSNAQETKTVITTEVGFYTSMVGAITGIVGEEISKANEGENPLALLAKVKEEKRRDSIAQDSLARAAIAAKADSVLAATDSTEGDTLVKEGAAELTMMMAPGADDVDETETSSEEAMADADAPAESTKTVEEPAVADAENIEGVTQLADGRYALQIGAFKYRPYAIGRQEAYGGVIIEEDGYFKVVKYFDTLDEAKAAKGDVEGDQPFMRHNK